MMGVYVEAVGDVVGDWDAMATPSRNRGFPASMNCSFYDLYTPVFIHNIREDNIPLWSLPSPSSASNVDLKEVALAWDQAPKWVIGPNVGNRAKTEKKYFGERSPRSACFARPIA